MDTVPARDLKIAENRNVQLKKENRELEKQLLQANIRAEQARHQIKVAEDCAESTLRSAAQKIDAYKGKYERIIKVAERFEAITLKDPTKSTAEIVKRDEVEELICNIIQRTLRG
jgi:hypothetical protein